MNNYLNDIKNKIAHNETAEAIRMLRALLENSPKLDEALLLSARFNALRQQIRTGTIHAEQALVGTNQIHEALLEFLSEIEVMAQEPEILSEIQAHTLTISGKNIVAGSIRAGGNVVIGDQIHTESKRSRQLQYFLLLFVPLLAIGLAFFYYRSQQLQEPLRLKVRLQELNPSPFLPFEGGQVMLYYGEKGDTQNIKQEAVFEELPPQYTNQTVQLYFSAPGFQLIDTTFLLDSKTLVLPIRRDRTYTFFRGLLLNEVGDPVVGARVTLPEIGLETDSDQNGQFSIQIPGEMQRPAHQTQITHPDYRTINRVEPIVIGDISKILMPKK